MGGKRKESRGGRKFFLLLFAMAGLGVGVWLFRSRRKDRS
jgi:cbb3-type cytochrome oxidase subunit 3